MAGNSSGTSATVKLDKTAPTISAAATPAANADGWNKTNVTVAYTCNDATSRRRRVPERHGDHLRGGTGEPSSRTAFDAADDSSAAPRCRASRSTRPPRPSRATVSGTPNGQGYRVAPVTVTFTCSDALSGLAVPPARPRSC